MTDPKLVAIDLDGTLLDDQKRVSTSNLSALKKLLNRNVAVAIATARDSASISQVLPLNQPGLYYLASGGALIYDPFAGEMIWTDFLDRDLIKECVTFLQQFDYPIFLNNKDDYWVDRYNERVEYIEERYHLRTQPFSDVRSFKHPVMRVSLAAPVEILRRAAAQAENTFASRLTVSLASQDWLDLLHHKAGKGALLEILQTRLGISAEQTMAIGDYESDLSLFEHAEIRIAMGNAVDLLKEAATHHTGSNNQDGVASAIYQHFSYPDQEGSAL